MEYDWQTFGLFKLIRIESHQCEPTSSTYCTAIKEAVKLALHQDRVEFKRTEKNGKSYAAFFVHDQRSTG